MYSSTPSMRFKGRRRSGIRSPAARPPVHQCEPTGRRESLDSSSSSVVPWQYSSCVSDSAFAFRNDTDASYSLLILRRQDTDPDLKDFEGYTAYDLYNSTIEHSKPASSPSPLADLYTWGTNRCVYSLLYISMNTNVFYDRQQFHSRSG